MLKRLKDIALKSYNTFAIDAISPTVYFPENIADLQALPLGKNDNFYILGDGSNTLFVEDKAPIIIKPAFKGVLITENEHVYTIKAGAAENWHQLVVSCVEQGIYGLENLVLIPGSVGAAPVQNIGAYGVEISQFCSEISWFDLKSKTIKTLSNAECLFGYRDSIFKNALAEQGIIVEITLIIPKKWQPTLNYAGLDHFPHTVSAKEILNQVITLRQSKLPDPKNIPNAGSFFKNPIVTQEQLTDLQREYPTMPFYPQTDGSFKLAAGWLIDQCGLKGFTNNGVGVHEKQALVLVNISSNQGKYLLDLAIYVRKTVTDKFAIDLTPEVRMVTAQGQCEFMKLVCNHV